MNLTRDEARERADLVTVQSYDVALDLTLGDETFRSTTTVRFNASEAAQTFIDLVAPTVHSATLNGVELDADAFDGLRLALPELSVDNELVVVADCAYMNTGEGLHRFVDPVDGEVYLYSQFEVADSRRVFAVFEQPDLKGTFTFHVTAPKDWQIFSNEAILSEDSANGVSTRHFGTTPRISSYITAIVAGPYSGFTDELTSSDGRRIPLGVYCRTSLVEYLDAEQILEVTRRGFEFFEDRFDFPYPFSKYDQIFVPEFNAGAMENAGCVTHTEAYVFRSKVTNARVERRAITILHELAHMWFGDLVTMTWWDDLWLNESFAEFMATACLAQTAWKAPNEHWSSSAWTTFSASEKSWAYRQDQLPSTHPIVATINDLEDVEVNFDGITYAKGASVLRQLVAYVGEEAFYRGIHAYFTAHAWTNTTLKDFLHQLEQASGRELATWSRQWLETAEVNLLRPIVTVDADGVISALEIEQSAPADYPTLRPHRLVVGGYDLVEGMVRTHRVELDIAGPRTHVAEFVGIDRPDVILVNDEDLAYAKIRLDDESLAAARANLRHFDDALARTMIWSATWDMTRDGELGARDYINLVLENITAESNDSSVLTVLLRQLASAAEHYVAPIHREEIEGNLSLALLSLSENAAPGSDAQLQFLKAFAITARTQFQLELVREFLVGDRFLTGLGIDTDLKWELVTALAAGDVLGESEISDYHALDLTASGARAAAGARATIPSMAAKREAFDLAVFDSNAPNAIQTATISGFSRCRDRELLVPYLDRYFGSVLSAWSDRPGEMAQNIVVGLYPMALAGLEETLGVDLIGETQTWLETTHAPAALRRLVVENLAGAERAVAAQRRDARL